MFSIGSYRKGWALRYMREARAELLAARKTPSIAHSLVLEATRKAQAAIYYSLGEPSFIEGIVNQECYGDHKPVDEPVLKCLVEIERAIQKLAQMPDSELPKTIGEVNEIVQIASDIVELFTGEKA